MRSTARPLLRALFALALLGGPAAWAQLTDVDRYLTAAARLYENLEYERALEQFERAKRLSRGPEDDAAIAVWEGIILADLDRREEALGAFRAGLLLQPEAKLPVKVSPKVERDFETTRARVNQELAPVLARRREELRAQQDAERRKREEQVREIERAREQAAARRTQQAEAARRKVEEERPVQADRPGRTEVWEPRLQPSPAATELQAQLSPLPPKPAPVLPYVMGGLAVAAGGAGGFFGHTSRTNVASARAAAFQDDRHRHLEDARTQALTANVLFAGAGAAAVGALVTALLHRGVPAPTPAEAAR